MEERVLHNVAFVMTPCAKIKKPPACVNDEVGVSVINNYRFHSSSIHFWHDPKMKTTTFKLPSEIFRVTYYHILLDYSQRGVSS